jgi:surface antigen
MTCASPCPLASARFRPLRRLGLSLVAGLVLALTLMAGIARADAAPQSWLPTTGDLTRSLRPCPMAVDAVAPPVCWSVTEDPAAWMAIPAGSPYPWGQCTYYAGLIRPDIWNDRAPPSADPLSDNWDAWTWVEHAQAEGLSVDGNPQPGDVMVYSQAAVGNQTGHVAIVDAVGPPSGAGVEVTISEMNVDGLDDAGLGQGDTLTLVVPRSQLAPGMIQFIHRPGRAYTAPAWPAGSAGGYMAAAASAPPATGDPSLSVGLADDRLETVSESTSPVVATVTALPGGALVKQVTVAANRSVALGVPGGSYRVCVAQAPDGVWPAVGACTTGAWAVAQSAVRVQAGRVQQAGRRLMVALAVSVSGPASIPGVPGVTGVARLMERRMARIGDRWVVRSVVVGRVALRLHRGRQVVRIPLPARALRGRRRGALLRLQIPAQTSSGYRIAATEVSRVVDFG